METNHPAQSLIDLSSEPLEQWEVPKLVEIGEIDETAGGNQTNVAENTGGFLTAS